MLPNFLIIGAPKAGSSTLAAYLAVHPHVFVAPEKEVHFFDDNFHRGLDWYRGRFAEVRGELAIGDATPTYMYSDEAIERMARLLPNAKLIVILRNPVERAYSHYWWNRALYEQRSFEDAIRAELVAVEKPFKRNYLAGGRYLERLERVCSHYPRSSLNVVILEELRASPGAAYAEVCRFLGVDERLKPSNLGDVLNPANGLRSPRLWNLMLRTRAWKRLPFGLANRIDRWNRLLQFSYPPMDARVRGNLERYYLEHNAALAAWLGRDLSVWQRLGANGSRDPIELS